LKERMKKIDNHEPGVSKILLFFNQYYERKITYSDMGISTVSESYKLGELVYLLRKSRMKSSSPVVNGHRTNYEHLNSHLRLEFLSNKHFIAKILYHADASSQLLFDFPIMPELPEAFESKLSSINSSILEI